MFLKKITLLLILNVYFPMLGQESKSENYVTAVAELVSIFSTGKRHDSHAFTFKITRVLKGETDDTLFRTQEISNDFGASDIFIKTDCRPYGDKPLHSKEVIIKYKPNGRFPLKWIAEKNRRLSLESLEILLESYAQKNKLKGNYNMLTEREGKLFFGEEDRNSNKIAIESRTGNRRWNIATFDRE